MIRRLSIILFLFSAFCSFGQTDTSFWFVAPDISATLGESPVNLHVQTYNQAATVYVRQPANPGGVSSTLTIPANTISVLNLSGSLTAIESAPVNSVSSKGLYISSNANVSVYYSIGAAGNKEMISLKGARAKGVDFYLPVPKSLNTATTPTDGGITCDVVATGTGVTTVLITPRAACIGRAKNVTFSVSLSQGETFSLRDNNAVNPSELGGTIVSANKPIAVTLSGLVSTATNCASYYADQITSSDNIGKEYVILRGQGSTDQVYVLSTVNSTSLSVVNGTNTPNTLINFGETYSFTPAGAMSYISSDKPVYVMHVSGNGCRVSGAQVPPAFCAGSYSTAFTRIDSDSLNLSIFTRSGFQNNFTLTSNGNTVNVPPASFSTVPGTGGALVAARLYFSTVSIAPGSQNILSNSQDLFGLGISNGDVSAGNAYAYGSQFATSAFVIPNAVPWDTICSNTTFTLNGLVGGGPITGMWSFNGSGNLSGPPSQISNNVYTPNVLDTVIKPLVFTLSSTGNCPNKSATFSLTVKQAPLVNAGSNQVICSNNATLQLNGNILGPTNQGIWSAVSPANGTFSPMNNILNPLYTASATDTALTSLKLVLTSTNNAGCNAVTDTLLIYMNKAPVVTASTVSPVFRCSNNPNVFLNGTVSGTVTSTAQWTTTGSGYFSPNNLSLISNYVPSASDISAGTVTLMLTSTNNQQCKPVTDSVTIVFTQPPTVNVGPDLNSCKNNAVVTLSAGIGGTVTNSGIWYGGNGTFTPSNTSPTATYIASPSDIANGYVLLTFSTTNNGLCNGVNDQLRIDFREKPVANFSVTNVCLNQLTQFTNLSTNPSGQGVLSGWQWNLGDGTLSSSVNPVHTFSSAGSFTAQLAVNNSYGCYDTIRRAFSVYPVPMASMSISRLCSGSSQQIIFTDLSSIAAPGTIPASGYFWDFGGNGYSNAKDTSIVFPSQGTYLISHEVTSANGCKATISQSLTITPKPQAKFFYLNNFSPALETSISFIDSSRAAVTWFWDFGNGLSSLNANPATTYSANGHYTVSLTVSDQFGCTSSYTAVIIINNIISEITQLIPNVVSPNNDGKNDIWRLDFINVYFPQADIEIYNRWGDRIFKSTGYSNAWDGTYNGSPLPVGVYFYVIKLNDPKDENIYKGTITLLK